VKVYQRSKEPAKGMAVHPIVRWMWQQMNHQRASQEDVAERSGVASSTMRKWRQGVNSPKLTDIEAVINVLGGKISVRISDDIRAANKEGSGERRVQDTQP
jgi:transcriptional regulator with XRE-family HTH domain